MSRLLHDELGKLKRQLLDLCSLVEENVARAVGAVTEGDLEAARRVIELDEVIDRREVDLEEECLKVLALHQPVAVDLRFIVTVMKVDNDLERMGDLAVNIAERALELSEGGMGNLLLDIEQMGSEVRGMVRTALDALIDGDVGKAQRVCEMDGRVDETNRDAYQRVLTLVSEDRESVEKLLPQLSVAKNLERIADHATNIAEDVVYLLEGRIVRHSGICQSYWGLRAASQGRREQGRSEQ